MEFLVETYLEHGDLERARLAGGSAFPEQSGVRHLRTVVIPEDESLLLFYEAPSVAAVREVLSSAGIACDRITEARSLPAAVQTGAAGG